MSQVVVLSVEEKKSDADNLTPSKVVELLDKYIIGQARFFISK